MNPSELLARLRERCDAWDAMHRRYFPDYDERWERVIDLLRTHADGRSLRVLDLGCGPGTLTMRLASAIPGLSVIGVDADPLLVEMAQAMSENTRAEFACLAIGGEEAPELLHHRAPFDAVVSSAFVHYFDPAALTGLNGLCRGLLADDGVLITAERFADHEDAAASASSDAGDTLGPWLTWWAETGAAPSMGGPEPPPLTLDAYLRTLAASGFGHIVHDTGASRIVVASKLCHQSKGVPPVVGTPLLTRHTCGEVSGDGPG